MRDFPGKNGALVTCRRMFSPIRQLYDCNVEFIFSNNTKVDLSSRYRLVWNDLLKFCRESVIDAVTDNLCSQPSVSSSLKQRKITLRNKKSGEKTLLQSVENICKQK